MHPLAALLFSIVLITGVQAGLSKEVVFKGQTQFDALLETARAENWRQLPIGERTGRVGLALVGTPYKSHTLEIDDHIEAPSVNFLGLDCWTFFEISLAFARMLELPAHEQTPDGLLRMIELDRYRNGKCTGSYLSRLHYLEDWIQDNQRRGLLEDITRDLGGAKKMNHVACEMTHGWKQYRYLTANPGLLPELARQEQRISELTVYYIPKAKVPKIEPKLRTGDIISVCSADGNYLGTSHVGLAFRDQAGALRFMHASAPKNYGRVIVDSRLSTYLNKFRSHKGIFVARPLK